MPKKKRGGDSATIREGQQYIESCERQLWTSSDVFDACEHGHEALVRLLLQHGVAVGRAMQDGCTPLFVACQEGHEAVVRLLLQHGGAVDHETQNGSSPLYIACEKGHEAVVRLLLQHGGAVDHETQKGSTPLHNACYTGHEEIARLLLDQGAAPRVLPGGREILRPKSRFGDLTAQRLDFGNSARQRAPPRPGTTMSRPRHAARALVGPARRTAPSRKQHAAHSRWSGARPPDPSAPGARRRPKYPLARAPPGRREAPVASDATSGRATPPPRAICGLGPCDISWTAQITAVHPVSRPPKLRPARRAGGPRGGFGPRPGRRGRWGPKISARAPARPAPARMAPPRARDLGRVYWGPSQRAESRPAPFHGRRELPGPRPTAGLRGPAREGRSGQLARRLESPRPGLRAAPLAMAPAHSTHKGVRHSRGRPAIICARMRGAASFHLVGGGWRASVDFAAGNLRIWRPRRRATRPGMRARAAGRGRSELYARASALVLMGGHPPTSWLMAPPRVGWELLLELAAARRLQRSFRT